MMLMTSALISLITSSAQAQEATGGAQSPNPIMSFLPFIVIFLIFYFLMIKPQKKKMEEEQSMINSIAKGDEIYTKSGIIGTITGITDKIITLEVSEGVKMKVVKGQIGGLAKKLFEDPKAKEAKK